MEPILEGKTFYACGLPVLVKRDEEGQTHIYRKDDGVKLTSEDFSGGDVYGGTKDGECDSTDVTFESGLLHRLCGGGVGGTVKDTIRMTVTGGLVTESLFGGGIGDRVGDIEMKISGGAVKKSIYVGGDSLSCRNTVAQFDMVTCSDVGAGLRPESSCQEGDIRFVMKDGNILSLFPAGGHVKGQVDLRIEGGYVEKRILPVASCDGGVHLHLYRGLMQINTLENMFPAIPESLPVEWFDTDDDGQAFHVYEETGADILDRTGEKGKLTLRFLEIRNPALPKYTARFPQFIGDCIFITFPSGGNMLVDCGLNYAEEEVVGTLKSLGVKKIDRLLITHHHKDHNGCAPAILSAFKVGRVLLPKIHTAPKDIETLQAYAACVEAIFKAGVKVEFVTRGDSFSVGFGFRKSRVTILNPNEPWKVATDINENSVALRIEYRESAVMLGGDITDKMEKEISDAHGKRLACDLLKLSHHGIVQQGNVGYIENCDPKYVVVQNLREEGVFIAVSRYQLNHVHHIPDDRIFVTGANGWIKAILGGKKGDIRITTQYK